MQASLKENYRKIQQESLKIYYQDRWEDMRGRSKEYISSFLGGERPKHQEYLEEVMAEVPGCWDFKKSGFKKHNYLSPSTVDGLIDSLAREDGIEDLDVPIEELTEEGYRTQLSHFLDAMEDLTGKEMETAFRSQYDVGGLEEVHLEAVKQVIEDK